MESSKRMSWRNIAHNKQFTHIKEFGKYVISHDYWNKFWPSLAEECRSSFRSLYRLGKEVCCWRTALAVTSALAIILPVYFLLAWAAGYADDYFCQPDGKFAVDSHSYYHLWDVSGIFQINMGFGAFSFSNAKLLDAVWDVVRISKRYIHH